MIQKWEPFQGREVKPIKKRKPRTYPERDLVHLPLMKLCKSHPILGMNAKFMFHVENERRTESFAQGNLRKAMGVKTAISDLLLLYPSREYHGLVMELKAPGRTPTADQVEYLESMASVGYCAIWFDNAKKAFEFLLWYLEEE